MFSMRRLLFFLALPLLAADQYLFTSFRSNGETGVFYAISPDGYHWTALEKAFLKPEQPGELMRDPFLTQGPDGTWHMLWTWGWNRKDSGDQLKLGYSYSKDLVHWAPHRQIVVMADEPSALNAWAPEALFDAKKKEWIVFWSTTIPGRFPDSDTSGDNRYNHRVYAATTKDWKQFSPSKLWFDPGFNCIDATVVNSGKRWIMIFKDERKTPLQKNLRLAFADSAEGPWKNVTEPFTSDWVEGPTAIQIGGWWYIYFDHYAKPQHYGAVRTRDWKSFEDVTGEMRFPPGQRHGTGVRISEELAKLLR